MSRLLTAQNCRGEVHLIIGVSNLTSFRVDSITQTGATPILISSQELSSFPIQLKQQLENEKVKWINRDFQIDHDLTTLGRDEVDNVIDRVFVTRSTADASLTKALYDKCTRLRIPINVTNSPELSSFTLLSTYCNGDFQLGITTSGKGCRLASRIKRELVNTLPPNIDEICNTVGELRTRIHEEDLNDLKNKYEMIDDSNEEDSIQTLKLNELVHEFEMSDTEKRLQRTRWLSQIVEYYPLKKLATLSIDDLSSAYHKYQLDNHLELSKQGGGKGSISLIGSGPGAVSLLTIGAMAAIYSADLILADKLVPQQILDLIPRSTELFIARKFPGNAELAQEELLNMGLSSLQMGKKVIRLKQGDPYIFGRGGEEYKFFQSHGYEPIVLPGITSALAAPVMTQIPVTHRETSDQVLIMTGTGRRGILPNLPDYVKSRTTIFLMALHRIVELVPELVEKRQWDINLPCCIVERASSPDQRVIRTTLQHVAELYQACGSRPPGLLVTGWACDVLKSKGQNDEKWIVEEGCGEFDDSNIIGLQDVISSLSKTVA